jgi:hypothetical protein
MLEQAEWIEESDELAKAFHLLSAVHIEVEKVIRARVNIRNQPCTVSTSSNLPRAVCCATPKGITQCCRACRHKRTITECHSNVAHVDERMPKRNTAVQNFCVVVVE